MSWTMPIVRDLKAFRVSARKLLAANVPPEEVRWIDDLAGDLFASSRNEPLDLFASAELLESKLPTLREKYREDEPEFAQLPSKLSVDSIPLAKAQANPQPNRAGSRLRLRRNTKTESVLSEQDGTETESQPTSLVPKEFLSITQLVLCHRYPSRCALLYRVLYRLTHGEHDLLKITIDDDVNQLMAMHKSVRRDRHKMTAFVRFRKITSDAGEHFMAWHRPDHYIVRLVAPFFVDRFASMKWTILTPDESMSWDGRSLQFGAGVARDPFAGEDDVQSLWTTYYANIFNPARIKLKAMQTEMPKKHWATMPETALIPELLRAAPERVKTMIRNGSAVSTAASIVPADRSLPVLRAAAATCRACPIGCNATQTVFGEGPPDARIVFVGEQPGDEEDRAGRPFIGPAGQVLAQIMREVGLDRSQIYVTNAVKHFKWEPRGKKRVHSKPSAREMVACKPWVEAELETIRPQFLVMLGNTAGHSLVGHHLRVTRDRGQWMRTKWCEHTMFTFHPSALLRAPTPELQQAMREQLTMDLRMVAEASRADE